MEKQRVTIPHTMGDVKLLVKRYRSLLLYGMIGGGAVIIDVGLFWLIDHATSISVTVNNAVSIFVAMVYSFLMNAHFNFKTTSNLLPRFISFMGVTGVGFLISTAIIWLLLPAVFIVQFLLNSRLTFKGTKETTEEAALESVL